MIISGFFFYSMKRIPCFWLDLLPLHITHHMSPHAHTHTHTGSYRFPWQQWFLLRASRLCQLKWRLSSSSSWKMLQTAGRCIALHGKPHAWWGDLWIETVSQAAAKRPVSRGRWWVSYHSPAGMPRVLQRAVPVSADPCGFGALLLLAEQPERVLPGRAVPESRGGRGLQRRHERHRRGLALLPKGHRLPHSQLTASHLLVRKH